MYLLLALLLVAVFAFNEAAAECTCGYYDALTGNLFTEPAGKETKDYLRSCVEDQDVQSFLEGSRFKKSVYMIVGLKIAKGAKVRKGSERSRETTAKVVIDGKAGGMLVKVGPQAEIKKDRQESIEWKDEKSFVFAYRLRKITCKKGKMVEDVEYNKGHSWIWSQAQVHGQV